MRTFITDYGTLEVREYVFRDGIELEIVSVENPHFNIFRESSNKSLYEMTVDDVEFIIEKHNKEIG